MSGHPIALAAPAASVPAEEKPIFVAGQWHLFWLKFRKHKVALASLFVIAGLYGLAAFAEFVAPYAPDRAATCSATAGTSHPGQRA